MKTGGQLSSLAERWRRLAGVDADVSGTLWFRSWSVIAGAAMVLFLPLWLSRSEQGYYYTFASLLALQVFFELGMNQVILQLASHAYAHLQVAPGGAVAGNSAGMSRLSSLSHWLHRWYRSAALAFFTVVSAGGAVFFAVQGGGGWRHWLGPWLLLTSATAVNLYLSARLSVLEGCGQVAGVARMRLAQSVMAYAAMWSALAMGAGLWAIPLLPAITAIYTRRWLRKQAHDPGSTLHASHPTADTLRWRHDVFPLQWRTALSWISGYFIANLLTPLTFAKHGPEEAGRLGITLAVFNAILTVGMSWVNAKVPAMAVHVARSEQSRLNTLFTHVAWRAVAITVALGLVAVFAFLMLVEWAPDAADRFASMPVIFCILVVTVANAVIYSGAAYMRAHKEEPMLPVSMVSAIAILVVTSVGVSSGVVVMMLLYMAVTVCLPLPWTIILFRRYHRKNLQVAMGP